MSTGISVSSLEKCLFRPSPHLLTVLFWCWVVWVLRLFWTLKLLADSYLCKYLSGSVGCLFILVVVFSAAVQKALGCYSPICLFCFCFPLPEEIYPKQFHEDQFSVLLMVSSRVFMASVFLNIFLSSLSYTMRESIQSDSLAWNCLDFQHHLSARLSFSHCLFFLPFLWTDYICGFLFWGSLFCSIDLYVCFYASTILFGN